jgi:predicted transcriptional regulator
MLIPKKLKILLEFEEPKSWKDTKVYLTYVGWWNAQKFLKERGIITENGVDEKGRKIWKLTDKGKKLVEHIKAIKMLLYEGKDSIRKP